MNDKFTKSEQMFSRDGMIYGIGTLCRFKAIGLPGGDEAFVRNVRGGHSREPLWRVEGRAIGCV
jgi:hypothetical protein